MELYIGRDKLKPEYYERRKSWFIRRNENETVYTEDNVWLEFETEEAAEDYLKEIYHHYEPHATLIP